MPRIQDKKCELCLRHYRGDGYKGVCTSACWAETHCPKLQRKKPLWQTVKYVCEHCASEYIAPRRNSRYCSDECQVLKRRMEDRDKTIKRSMVKEYKERKPPSHKTRAKLEHSHLEPQPGWLKKFKTVRG